MFFLFLFSIEFEGLLNIYSMWSLLFCKLEHYSKFIQYFIAFIISLKQILQHYNNQYNNDLIFYKLMTEKVKTLYRFSFKLFKF